MRKQEKISKRKKYSICKSANSYIPNFGYVFVCRNQTKTGYGYGHANTYETIDRWKNIAVLRAMHEQKPKNNASTTTEKMHTHNTILYTYFLVIRHFQSINVDATVHVRINLFIAQIVAGNGFGAVDHVN